MAGVLGVIELYDAAVGGVTVVLLGYLLYSGRLVVHYRRFFYLLLVGLLLSLSTGLLLAGVVPPAAEHLLHGVAFLFVTAGLFDLVAADRASERTVPWETRELESWPRRVEDGD